MYYKKPTALELSASLILFPTMISVITVFILILPFSKDDLTIIEIYEERYLKIIVLSMQGVFFYFVSKELKKKRIWARVVTLITGILLLIGFPVGTFVGTILIYNMTKNWSKIIAEIPSTNAESNANSKEV